MMKETRSTLATPTTKKITPVEEDPDFALSTKVPTPTRPKIAPNNSKTTIHTETDTRSTLRVNSSNIEVVEAIYRTLSCPWTK